MKATWNNTVIAESNETILIEGNHYFPKKSISKDFLQASEHTSTCPWKGEAHYYDVIADKEKNINAAWYYPKPKEGSIEKVGKDFSNYIAFWKGVIVD
jgi:uncharacterized protein (DUF427 family)